MTRRNDLAVVKRPAAQGSEKLARAPDAMSHELICSWLGLSPDGWPPDHYRLLGLEPGEADVAVIEQRVHQRLDRVRPYQMMHPEPATEAMKRIAEAWVCLTDPI